MYKRQLRNGFWTQVFRVLWLLVATWIAAKLLPDLWVNAPLTFNVMPRTLCKPLIWQTKLRMRWVESICCSVAGAAIRCHHCCIRSLPKT